ncbi:PQQ-binding-like beta-propeller repeat protein [Deinococcus yunweiensis]|uniref:outer membrane protein assembly factor BamB family protein n=1 Tax=Deinococcus yunweiensis TaxID=367282 RepID=UPI00398EF6EF
MTLGSLRPVWSYATYSGVSTLDGSDTLLIVPVRGSQLAALDPRTGEERWRHRDVWRGLNQHRLIPNRVVFLDGYDRLVTLDANTGEELWTVPTVSMTGWLHATPDVLVMGAWRDYTPLQAFDARSGGLRWMEALPHPARRTAWYAPLDALMTVMDDRVQCRALTDGRVVAELALPGLLATPMPDWQFSGPFGTPGRALLERGEGDQLLIITGPELHLEERHLGREPVTLRLVEQGGEVFFQDAARQLCAYDLGRDVTTVLGPLENTRRDRIPAVRLPDGTVLAGTSSGLLVRYAPEGGVRERVRVVKRVLTPLTLVSDTVCFGTQSGQVMAWTWRDVAAAPTAHPIC